MFNLLKNFNFRKEVVGFSCRGANPEWTPRNYAALATEGFQKNVFVYRAINLVSEGIASIPVSVRNRDLSENAELTKLFFRPNASQGRSAFFNELVHSLMLSGNAFVFYNGGEMVCLRPDRVKVVPNKEQNSVDSYVYEVEGRKVDLRKDEVLHIKLFNPLNDWYGFAPIQAATLASDQYNEMSKHNFSMLKNGGRPSGCLILKDIYNLTKTQREQLRKDLKDAYAGSTNAGKIMVLEGAFDWKEMALSPKDLDFSESRNAIAREIIQAFGVPPILVGIRGDSSFNNYKEARMHFWEDTVLPLAELIRTEFTHWISRIKRVSVEVVFDLDAIPALISKREALWNKVCNADFLTTDEKREILGFPKLRDVPEEEKSSAGTFSENNRPGEPANAKPSSNPPKITKGNKLWLV